MEIKILFFISIIIHIFVHYGSQFSSFFFFFSIFSKQKIFLLFLKRISFFFQNSKSVTKFKYLFPYHYSIFLKLHCLQHLSIYTIKLHNKKSTSILTQLPILPILHFKEENKTNKTNRKRKQIYQRN